jgi:kynureninase
MFGAVSITIRANCFDIKKITEAAHKANAIAGFDLAHVAGNVPVLLHDWNVDFAVWCSYKYLNVGPGAVGGVYVHEFFSSNVNTPRLGGWWGNEEKARVLKWKKDSFPKTIAGGWNISTAQVFNMVTFESFTGTV